MAYYADYQLIQSLSDSLSELLSGFYQNIIFWVFTLNDYRVSFGDKFAEIKQEYLVIRMLCDLIQQIRKCIWWTAYLIFTNVFCVRVKPVFIKEWIKVGYISDQNLYDCMYNDNFFDLPFLSLPYSHYYNPKISFISSYTEYYLHDTLDIQRLSSPEHMLVLAKEKTMMVVRKTCEGPHIVRQLCMESASTRNISDEIIGLVPEKSSFHFLLVYLQFLDPPVRYEINVPIEEYYVGNELLSYEYLISYMDHQWVWKMWKIDWNDDYLVKVMDSDLKIFEVKKGEYVRLEKDRAVVCSIRNVHIESEKVEDEVEAEVEAENESSREIRTLSMEEDAEMLMLFSGKHTLYIDSGSDTEDVHKNKKMKYE